MVKLPYFIVYALHWTKLHPLVTFVALVLLQWLKARFPTTQGSLGHRLFVSAFMLASKVICDNTYSNKLWSIIAQGMCQYLEWELNIDLATLKEFEEMVCKDFAGPGPYPTYILPPTKKSSPLPTTIPFAATPCGISPSPSNKQRYQSPPKMHYLPPMLSFSSPLETPSPTYSTSSPTSSVSPPTPIGIEDLSTKIVLASSSLGYLKVSEHVHAPPTKSKMFTFTSPAVW